MRTIFHDGSKNDFVGEMSPSNEEESSETCRHPNQSREDDIQQILKKLR
jgi:hypothetical protein